MKRKNTTFNAKFKGFDVINNPFLNKGTAFTAKERAALHLQGLLPDKIETLHEQVQRTYKQFQSYSTKLLQNIFLNELYNVNRNLFYKLVQSHVTEMLPIIYTPIVGNLVQQFSHEFRQQPRGLYISYQNRKHISEILDTYKNSEIDIIVVTDGEGVLGIGDQGVGSIEIPVAKLMLYTLFAGINPAKTIPIVLDVGTNNEALLNDPNYLGWRHSRIADKQYDKFIEEFVHTVKKKFPKVFFHWEDFGRDNAAKNLAKYQNFMCSFNDDIQGTGVVTLAAILAALGATRQNINEQRIVIFGAGSAGTGIADQIKSAMIRNGLAENEAIKNFWLLNSKGLVTDKSQNLTPNQKTYLRNSLEISSWQLQSQNKVDLFDVVKNVKPTILIGCSTVKGAFTKEIIIEMAKSTEIPMIFPLSNPNEKSEATPSDLINWTAGKALIATGSPFEPVKFNDKTITVSQCNNALAFPGIGLGVVVTKAKKLTDDMLWEATQSLLKLSPILNKKQNLLLPSIEDAPQAACDIALAVAKQAVKEKVAQLPKGKNIKTIIRNTTDNQAKK